MIIYIIIMLILYYIIYIYHQLRLPCRYHAVKRIMVWYLSWYNRESIVYCSQSSLACISSMLTTFCERVRAPRAAIILNITFKFNSAQNPHYNIPRSLSSYTKFLNFLQYVLCTLHVYNNCTHLYLPHPSSDNR